MIRLLRLVSWGIRWITRSPRRAIGFLVVPVLVGIALAAGPMRDRPATTPDVLADGRSAVPPAASPSGPRSTELPGTTGAATPVPTLPAFRLTDEQRAPAVGYVTAANTHDARPGGDKAFTDSYARTRPYVTDEVYAQVTAPSRRGDYQWGQWRTAQATVSVRVVATGVPDGAPAPTGATAYARVEFSQRVTPTAGASGPSTTAGAVNLLLRKGTDGTWRVAQLLADT